MFTKSIELYDRLYAWKDYRAETAKLIELIRERCPDAETLLDVACGTGAHLALLTGEFEVAGVDISPEFLELARRRVPDVPLHVGDMQDFELGETFDVVCVLFSSIGYVRTLDALGRTIQNLADHVAPGGLLVVEPWLTPEAFLDKHVHATFVDDDDLKIARISNTRVDGRTSILEFSYLVGTPDGTDYYTETHELGMFTHDETKTAFEAAGLDVTHDAQGLMDRSLFLGRKSE